MMRSRKLIYRHDLRQETGPNLVEQGPEALGLDGVAEVEAVAVELLDGAGGDDHAGLVAAELEEVEAGDEGPAEGRGYAVVRGGGPAEQVDLGLGLGAGDGAADVRAHGGDGDCEKNRHFFKPCLYYELWF